MRFKFKVYNGCLYVLFFYFPPQRQVMRQSNPIMCSITNSQEINRLSPSALTGIRPQRQSLMLGAIWCCYVSGAGAGWRRRVCACWRGVPLSFARNGSYSRLALAVIFRRVCSRAFAAPWPAPRLALAGSLIGIVPARFTLFFFLGFPLSPQGKFFLPNFIFIEAST